MISFFDESFNEIEGKKLNECFKLRKKTFSDRLKWAVKCKDNMEFDEYDNENASYIFGVSNDSLICSARLIETKHPNMITHTFHDYFKDLKIPEGNFIESSRFFVDKERAADLLGSGYPVTHDLFLAIVNYARQHGYDGILTIVSHAMMLIIKRSGWKLSILNIGVSEKHQNIYLLQLPVDEVTVSTLMSKITKHNALPLAA
ncbi:acyl-homoserine-lactone synthase [Scandinavium sp. V105_16]|uniref:Acyl-homoserine-lactone synthase n=1 Tax=Scandinavium lactucae TaxID=3095028 RepID=A0AAJ2S4T7_9ENTR|nr:MULTISPECIES: acyl-homoserine-lactone synthase [unclassified Scandinavium]MDX6019047.1 acyl-homoserine-lactone synthase [Scandinavium sp. V105_16]MDX6029991.1 acyl-homoserine-lactone synthase [Scandinavium sp. V105_12]MDX6039353.1 acyl-homoserine-lactone synthase [Scandinavium sp. V105_6]MDX6050424.1 acyl-homoserine-lactone synthase [Scandinavium sp. V105_1]